MFYKNNRYLIKTPTGYEHFEGIQKKIVNTLYTFHFDDGSHIKSSGKHRFLTDKGFEKTEDISVNQILSNKKILKIEQ